MRKADGRRNIPHWHYEELVELIGHADLLPKKTDRGKKGTQRDRNEFTRDTPDTLLIHHIVHLYIAILECTGVNVDSMSKLRRHGMAECLVNEFAVERNAQTAKQKSGMSVGFGRGLHVNSATGNHLLRVMRVVGLHFREIHHLLGRETER
jgi:hypothetical protein